MESSMEFPQKIKNTTIIPPSNSTCEYFSKENKNTNIIRYMYSYVHFGIIHNFQDTEAT